MAVRPIRTYGDPVLRLKAKRVAKIDSSIQHLIDDMIDTMRAAPGVGLAANQVGIPLRVAVIEMPEREGVITLINPEIVKRFGERILDEGCLSLPGYVGEIKRSVRVIVKARDRNGKEIRLKGEGLLAQALEHEIDHLDGVLYVDHLESPDKLHKQERPSPEDTQQEEVASEIA
ncbi:MAG: peptide deformylase [Chloroflexi bacterium]|nr:peptide deformylase [Chloroflexota bacterium]